MNTFNLDITEWTVQFQLWAQILLLVLTMFFLNRSNRLSRSAHWLVLIIIAIQIIVFIVQQYYQWYRLQTAPSIGRYLLPPYNQIWLEVAKRETISILINWVTAAVFFAFLANRWHRWYGKEFYSQSDIVYLTLGTLAVGWPSVFVFLAGTVGLAILSLLSLALIRKKTLQDRLIITPFIIPSAILTLIFENWLLDFTRLSSIRF